jgi:nudix-type nucleoside diphosphatase (YffH/AdpP family)
MTERVRYLGSRVLSKAWGKLTLHRIRYRMPDGSTVDLDREVYDHGAAVTVLMVNRGRRKVLLTRQFRIAVDVTGYSDDLLEACAGLDGGERAAEAARREALEETGIEVQNLVRVFSCFMSPGSLTERVTGFIAFYDTTPAGRGGLAEEHEDIELVELDFDAARDLVMSGAIHDAKTLMLLQHALLTGLLD